MLSCEVQHISFMNFTTLVLSFELNLQHKRSSFSINLFLFVNPSGYVLDNSFYVSKFSLHHFKMKVCSPPDFLNTLSMPIVCSFNTRTRLLDRIKWTPFIIISKITFDHFFFMKPPKLYPYMWVQCKNWTEFLFDDYIAVWIEKN